MSADILRSAELGAHRRALPGPASGTRGRAPGPATPGPVSPPPADCETQDRRHAEEMRRAADEARAAAERAVEALRQKITAEARLAEQRRAAEHAERLAALTSLLAQAGELRRMTRAALEQEAIALAYTALCRIAGPQPEAGALLAGIVRQAFAQQGDRPAIAVRMHPLDLATLEAHREGKALLEASRGVRWMEDPAVPRAGCVLRSDVGELDASLDTQLASLRALWCAHHASFASDSAPEAGDA